MASITAAAFKSAYPEFASADSDALDHAVAVANALTLALYSKATEEAERRYLEAAALLLPRPRGKSLVQNWPALEANPYRAQAAAMDRAKAGANRGISSWALPPEVT